MFCKMMKFYEIFKIFYNDTFMASVIWRRQWII